MEVESVVVFRNKFHFNDVEEILLYAMVVDFTSPFALNDIGIQRQASKRILSKRNQWKMIISGGDQLRTRWVMHTPS